MCSPSHSGVRSRPPDPENTGSPFAFGDNGGRPIESLDSLRRHAGLPRRWQPLVVTSTADSPRERAVDELVRRGYTTVAIAAELAISPRTVTADRARLRSRVTPIGRSFDDSKVCVIGRPTLLRDLVHDCLIEADVGVAPVPGSRIAAAVVVVVEPSARDFDVRPGARIVTCGSPPDSVGLVGAVRRGLVAVLSADPTPDEAIHAVRRAAEGSASFPQALIERLVDELYGPDAGSAVLSNRDPRHVGRDQRRGVDEADGAPPRGQPEDRGKPATPALSEARGAVGGGSSGIGRPVCDADDTSDG